jgi:hypothetical protein
MNITIDNIRDWVQVKNKKRTVRIDGLWQIKCLFQPSVNERVFDYQILVAQTVSQGACYHDEEQTFGNILEKLVGENYNGEPTGNKSIDIALLDSLASSFNIKPSLALTINGQHSEKSKNRADIILNEVHLLKSTGFKRKIKVCNIGVVSTIIQKLLIAGFDVSASDNEIGMIGKKIFDKVHIQSGAETLNLVANSDIAIVTGMAISTDTLSNIVTVAKQNKTKVILFAETGSGFAPFYINNGIDCVVSEPFPFYTFDGETQIKIYHAIK